MLLSWRVCSIFRKSTNWRISEKVFVKTKNVQCFGQHPNFMIGLTKVGRAIKRHDNELKFSKILNSKQSKPSLCYRLNQNINIDQYGWKQHLKRKKKGKENLKKKLGNMKKKAKKIFFFWSSKKRKKPKRLGALWKLDDPTSDSILMTNHCSYTMSCL